MYKVEVSRELYNNCKAMNRLDKHHLSYWLSDGIKDRVEGWLTVAKHKGLEKVLSLHHFTAFKKELVLELYSKLN